MRRAGLAGKEDAVIDRRGETGAVVGMAGQRVGIGAAGEFVPPPERRPQRPQVAAHIASQQPGQFVDRERRHRVNPVALEPGGKASAEKAVDARPPHRPDLIAHRLAPPGRADQIALGDVLAALEVEKQFVGEAER